MRTKVPYLDRIWRVRDTIALPDGISPEIAFERLAPLFATPGTSCEVAGDTLTYSKENPAAQDKLATFTSGTLRLERAGGSDRLSYDVGSAALFLCFLAPLLFLAFAQLAVLANAFEGPEVEDARGADAEEEEEAEEPAELHWIDQMLGAPAPESKDEKDKDETEEDEDEGKHSPTPGYVLAGIFAAVYLVGRVLEPFLLKRTFRSALEGRATSGDVREAPGAAASTKDNAGGPQASEFNANFGAGG
jgi:hypothetical protein